MPRAYATLPISLPPRLNALRGLPTFMSFVSVAPTEMPARSALGVV
jgi:hypothetical protein